MNKAQKKVKKSFFTIKSPKADSEVLDQFLNEFGYSTFESEERPNDSRRSIKRISEPEELFDELKDFTHQNNTAISVVYQCPKNTLREKLIDSGVIHPSTAYGKEDPAPSEYEVVLDYMMGKNNNSNNNKAIHKKPITNNTKKPVHKKPVTNNSKKTITSNDTKKKVHKPNNHADSRNPNNPAHKDHKDHQEYLKKQASIKNTTKKSVNPSKSKASSPKKNPNTSKSKPSNGSHKKRIGVMSDEPFKALSETGKRTPVKPEITVRKRRPSIV